MIKVITSRHDSILGVPFMNYELILEADPDANCLAIWEKISAGTWRTCSRCSGAQSFHITLMLFMFNLINLPAIIFNRFYSNDTKFKACASTNLFLQEWSPSKDGREMEGGFVWTGKLRWPSSGCLEDLGFELNH